MKKLIIFASVGVFLGFGLKLAATATEPENTRPAKYTATTAFNLDGHIKSVYNQIDFGKNKLDFEVFEKAYLGYLNLRDAGKLNSSKELLTVCDFSKSSTENRLWVIDLKQQKVLINDYVAHGQGSGMEYATQFSNRSNSHQSSLGFYVTDDTYMGKHGLSLRVRGQDQGYNSAAYERAVVVHGADYVSKDFVAGQKRLGRSWGCPAVSRQLAPKFIDLIKDRTVLFVYAPQKDYLASSVWLNKKVNQLPEQLTVKEVKAADTVINM